MHEFSIALSIIDIANEYAVKAKSDNIIEIEIEVGDVSGVISEALEFSLESAVKNSVLEKATRKIIKIPGMAKCNDCGTQFNIDNVYGQCPGCSSYDNEVIKGKELRVKSLLID